MFGPVRSVRTVMLIVLLHDSPTGLMTPRFSLLRSLWHAVQSGSAASLEMHVPVWT